MTGAAAAAMTIEKFWVASGLTPLVAVTVPVYVLATVGVPESTPADVSVTPAGSAPDVTVKLGAGVPVATYVCEYGIETLPAGGAALVIAGAVPAPSSFWIVPVPVAVPSVALTGELSVTVNVSFASGVVSPLTSTERGCVVTPGLNVTVPDLAV
jgi:hypothetical protein